MKPAVSIIQSHKVHTQNNNSIITGLDYYTNLRQLCYINVSLHTKNDTL